MSRWVDDAIRETPKKEPVKDSWWTRPMNRQEFQRQLVDTEIVRMNGNQTFGGSKRTHDKFSGDKK